MTRKCWLHCIDVISEAAQSLSEKGNVGETITCHNKFVRIVYNVQLICSLCSGGPRASLTGRGRMAAEQWSKFIGLLGDQTRDHDTTALADDALIFAGLHLNADPPHQAPWGMCDRIVIGCSTRLNLVCCAWINTHADTSHVKNAFDALSASLQFLSSASTSVFASTNIVCARTGFIYFILWLLYF